MTEGDEIAEMKEYFDNQVWPILKKNLKEATKKEACFASFVAGSNMMQFSFEEKMKEFEKEVVKMSKEEIEEILGKKDAGEEKDFSGDQDSLSEDKTKVNGVLIDGGGRF
jgi:hypothetical protein